jgi:hypothetical protein
MPMKPLVLAIALALVAPLPAMAQTATAKATATAPSPAWVARSNAYAQILLDAQGPFQPELVSFFGIPGYDDQVFDLKPDNGQRFRDATAKAKAELQQKLQSERDPNVRQDLAIMIAAADQRIEGGRLTEELMLPWIDAPQNIFSGMNGLLSKQTPPERRAKAFDRLRRYVGQTPDTTPVTVLARQRYEEALANPKLLPPTKLEVERALANVDTYAKGIRALFGEYKIEGAEPALAALDTQFKEYKAWVNATVLPKARTDTRLPPALYAFQLKQYGIDIDPKLLIQRAELEFMETRAAMQQIAPLVAKAKGIDATDYRDVIRALKRDAIPNDRLEGRYREVIDAIDPIIRAQRIVDVPKRPMQMRLGTEAESAAQPARSCCRSAIPTPAARASSTTISTSMRLRGR